MGGNEVAARISGVIDLHAADAQYHVPCYNRPSITEPLEEALWSVLSMMAENATESWTLYVKYVAASGTVSRRQFVSNATAHFGDELLVLHSEGCDIVVGFKASLGKVIKSVGLNMKIGPIFSWADNYDLYIATCPHRHRYDNACVPPKDSECLWNAVHPRLSRPPIVSDCIPIAIKRTSALVRPHSSPRHDAHSHERTRRGIAKAVRLIPNSLLPCREDILHNATNKSLLNGFQYGYPLHYNI